MSHDDIYGAVITCPHMSSCRRAVVWRAFRAAARLDDLEVRHAGEAAEALARRAVGRVWLIGPTPSHARTGKTFREEKLFVAISAVCREQL